MSGKLIGGPDLRARLASLAEVPPEFARQWAEDTRAQAISTAPPHHEPASGIWTIRALRTRGAVYGAFWWLFVDRGTKRHDIVIKNKRVLSNRTTIFGTKVDHKRIARRPFISRAAQDALSGSAWAETVVKSWNKRRLRGQAFL